MVNNAEDNKNLLSRDGEYDGSVQMTCICRLFSNYLLRVHYKYGTNTIDYGFGSIVCHLLFSNNYDSGYFDTLQNNS